MSVEIVPPQSSLSKVFFVRQSSSLWPGLAPGFSCPREGIASGVGVDQLGVALPEARIAKDVAGAEQAVVATALGAAVTARTGVVGDRRLGQAEAFGQPAQHHGALRRIVVDPDVDVVDGAPGQGSAQQMGDRRSGVVAVDAIGVSLFAGQHGASGADHVEKARPSRAVDAAEAQGGGGERAAREDALALEHQLAAEAARRGGRVLVDPFAVALAVDAGRRREKNPSRRLPLRDQSLEQMERPVDIGGAIGLGIMAVGGGGVDHRVERARQVGEGGGIAQVGGKGMQGARQRVRPAAQSPNLDAAARQLETEGGTDVAATGDQDARCGRGGGGMQHVELSCVKRNVPRR